MIMELVLSPLHASQSGDVHDSQYSQNTVVDSKSTVVLLTNTETRIAKSHPSDFEDQKEQHEGNIANICNRSEDIIS